MLNNPDIPKCPTCKHVDAMPAGTMFCRRVPPTVVLVPDPDSAGIIATSVWPAVFASDHCGEYQIRPTPAPEREYFPMVNP